MLPLTPTENINDVYEEFVKPSSQEDAQAILNRINKHNENKRKMIGEVKNKMRNLELSEYSSDLKDYYEDLTEIGEATAIELKASSAYENYLFERHNADTLDYSINQINLSNINYTKGRIKELDEDHIRIILPEKIISVNREKEYWRGKVGETNEENLDIKKDIEGEVTISHINELHKKVYNLPEKKKTSFTISSELLSNRLVPRKEKKPSSDIMDIINRLKETQCNNKVVEDIIYPYYTSQKLLEITRLIENMTDSIILKYNSNTPIIIDVLVEKNNFNYLHVPQESKILISDTPISIKKDYFTRKFPEKQDVTQKEWSEILIESGLSLERVKSYENRDIIEHRLHEYEKLCIMKQNKKITKEDMNYYKYTPSFSTGNEDDIIKLINEGKNIREKLLEKGFEKIVNDIDNQSYITNIKAPLEKRYL